MFFYKQGFYIKSWDKPLDLGFNENYAWQLALRLKRGLVDTSEPGAFTKDALYYSGFLKVSEFLETNPNNDLFYGKISLNYVQEVKRMTNLVTPKYLPLSPLKPQIL